jgi:hypothetical protein
MRVITTVIISVLFINVCSQDEPPRDWAELRPILQRLNLYSTTHQKDLYKGTWGLEEADAKAYGPVSGVTLFLSPCKDRCARYWMRVEDYSTADAAFKRASEYIVPGETYKRLDKILAETRFADGSAGKNTLRLWAVARGKRVYTLTTDASASMQINLPEKLKATISKLPEK